MRRRRPMHRVTRLLLLVPLVLATTAQRSTLHVEVGNTPVEWWSSDRAPIRWGAPLALVADAFRWKPLRAGLDVAITDILVNRGLLRLTTIAVRLDPRQFDIRLDHRAAANGVTAAWSIDDVPADGALAFNAGQFEETGPWGWLVLHGTEMQYPKRGPLSMAVSATAGGTIEWIADNDVFRRRAAGTPGFAFQSYPLLLDADGQVPVLLRESPDLDRAHRDTRLAMGRLPDGQVLIVLTRFGSGGRLLERLPAGLTTPEMAALMGALGARPALMLDGGLSAQMLVRDSDGVVRTWRGGRKVPLGLVATPRLSR